MIILNSNMRILYIVMLFFIVLPNFTWAQTENTFGFMPTLNFNSSLAKDWFINVKIESRQELFREDFDYSYRLTKLAFRTGKKVGIRTKLAAGYQAGISSEETYHRFIQQLSHVNKYQTLILAHRVQLDQTLFKNDNTEYRIRYRLTAEFPLSGQIIDPNEFFVKISNEYLNSTQNKEYQLEIRAVGYIGYVFSPKSMLEFGLDNRMNSFMNERVRNRLWLGLNFYQSF